MKAWISKWLIFVSAGHTVVGVILFSNIYMEMISRGLVGSVTSEKTAAAAWFLLFGFLLFITSLLISVIEKHDTLEIPNSIGISLFTLTTIGVILMPASGFWLVYPAVIAIVFKNRKDLPHIKT
jgi:CHASE2 domain-containing sensor protein